MSFEEFLEFILAVRQMKEEKEASVNWCRMKPAKEVDDFLGRLPYELTNAQEKKYGWKSERIYRAMIRCPG